MPATATYVTVAWSECLSSVTLVHPCKAAGRNKMPHGRDTCVVQSNIRPGRWSPHGKGRLGGRNSIFRLASCIAESYISYCDTCYRLSKCLNASSVTLMHPANATEQNEMPCGRYTRVVTSNTVLDRGLVPHGKGRFGLKPPFRSNAA